MKIASPKKFYGLLTAMTLTLVASFPLGAFAAGPPVPSTISNSMAQILLMIIAALLLVIVMLANVVMGAADVFSQRYKESKKNGGGKILSVILLCLVASSAMAAADPAAAATATAAPAVDEFGGLSATTFYTLITVIFLELFAILGLLYNLKKLLAKDALVTGVESAHVKSFDFGKWWWEKFNSLRPESEEANIDLGHDYDGIRELDNRLPPWWLYGFYLCIIFAAIYLYRFHVAHSAPLSKEELQLSLDEAAIAKEEYLKHAANKVDENTVTYLTDAANLGEGKKIFTTICMACHLADGGGSVGPNLTDKYWIHGGGIKDIFKTIKYGWPEKGMKSWKDDYSPVQIAQLSSYVKSLGGTTPAKAKEPQGVLYEDVPVAVAADSSKIADAGKKPDSTSKK